MADLTAVEQRCLKIVAMAERQARDARRALEQENAALREQLSDKQELYVTQFEQLEASIKLHFVRLQDITNAFLATHRENWDAIHAAQQQRQVLESSLLAHTKEQMLAFMSFASREKKRGLVRLLQRAVSHFSSTSREVFASFDREGELAEIQRMARAVYRLGGHENVDIAERFLQWQQQPDEDEDDGREAAEWDEASLLQHRDQLIQSSSLGRSVSAIISTALSGSGSGDASITEASPALAAVMLYLIGAADVLERFGLMVTGAVGQFERALDRTRRDVLLADERQLLRACAASAVPANEHVIRDDTVAEALLRSIAAAAGRRDEMLAAQLQSMQRASAQHLAAFCEEVHTQLLQPLLPLVLDGLYMNEEDYRRRAVAPPPRTQGLPLGTVAVRAERAATHSYSHLDALLENDHGTTGMNDGQSSDEDAAAVRAGSGSVVAQAPLVVSALYRLASESSTLGDKLLIHATDRHLASLRRANTECSLQLDALRRHSSSANNVIVEQRVTEFRLEDFRSDSQHQHILRTVFMDREVALRQKYAHDNERLQHDVEHLRSLVDKAAQDNSLLRNQAALLTAEVTLLREVANKRDTVRETLQTVREETKVVNYSVNHGTFGETWQESLLRLRERTLQELSTDNARFLAKLRSFLKRNEVDQVHVELLYEERLNSVVERLEQDHAYREACLRKRCDAVVQNLHDAHATELADVRESARSERDRIQSFYENEYLARVEAVNKEYQAKARKLRAREAELEERFCGAVARVRREYRRRENELETKLFERYAEMNATVEEESNRLKEAYDERRRDLEREHLQAGANLEMRVNDMVQAVKKQFDALSLRLQQDVVRFVGEKQTFFDTYRSTELSMFSDFVRAKEKMTAERYETILASMKRDSELQLKNLREEHQREVHRLEEETRAAQQAAATDADARIQTKQREQERAFHVAHEMHEQHDAAFWQQCHVHLAEGERRVIERSAALEVEHSRRYGQLTAQYQEFLNHDMRAAREAFEGQMRRAYSQFHISLVPMARLHLAAEHLLWDEMSERAHIQHTYYVQFAFLRSSREDGRLHLLKRELSTALDGPSSSGQFLSIDDFRSLREKFDRRLADEHSYVANLSRDTIATFEVGLEASHKLVTLAQVEHANQVEDLKSTLLAKRALNDQTLLSLVSDSWERVVDHCKRWLDGALERGGGVGPTRARGPRSDELSRVPIDVEAMASAWEARIEELAQASMRHAQAVFRPVHDEYIATTTALMDSLERTRAQLSEAQTWRLFLEQVVAAQCSTLKLEMPLPSSQRLLPQHAARNAEDIDEVRERLFVADLLLK